MIVDEVHSFDRRMFANLVSFLKHFDVPVLCMTATLPVSRRDELEQAGLRVFPNESEAEKLGDLTRQESALRYVHRQVEDETVAYEAAVSSYRDGRRVLCVVNTVARAQALEDRLEQALST